MVDQDSQPPQHQEFEALAENAEAQVFATIVRYLAERLTDVEPDVDPGDLAATGELFIEIAEAFETTSGFEFTSDQALPLSHAMVMLEGGMRILAEQAEEQGHYNAAAKMEWAALKARNMTAKLETHHLSGSNGIIAFDLDDGDEADSVDA
ncbi:MAG: hypothetical protein NUV50_14275 [Rhodospirillales bacterium]|nr:hypothetical protein [Rhodospirillales bacterium]